MVKNSLKNSNTRGIYAASRSKSSIHTRICDNDLHDPINHRQLIVDLNQNTNLEAGRCRILYIVYINRRKAGVSIAFCHLGVDTFVSTIASLDHFPRLNTV